MDIPDAVTVGVVLYTPRALALEDLERESAYAADVAARAGVPRERAFGQAIARIVPRDTFRVILARTGLDPSAELLGSTHYFTGRPEPALVAGALAVFAHAWLYRREHGAEPTGSLPLADMPPGPLANARTLREAAVAVNDAMLDAERYGPWIARYQALWEEGLAAS